MYEGDVSMEGSNNDEKEAQLYLPRVYRRRLGHEERPWASSPESGCTVVLPRCSNDGTLFSPHPLKLG